MPDPTVRQITLPVDNPTAVAAARLLLERGNALRHDPQKFETAPLPSEDPDDDWGVAAQLIASASQELSEALPNGSLHRTQCALRALIIGQQLLTEALRRRGVRPAVAEFFGGEDASA